jgi:hypothetical protein
MRRDDSGRAFWRATFLAIAAIIVVTALVKAAAEYVLLS